LISGSRRTDEQNIVSAAAADFQGAFHVFLAFDFGKIAIIVVLVLEKFRDVHFCGRDFYFAFEECALRASSEPE